MEKHRTIHFESASRYSWISMANKFTATEWIESKNTRPHRCSTTIAYTAASPSSPDNLKLVDNAFTFAALRK